MPREDTFGLWLKRQRKALDLTQEELAQQVFCSPKTIYKIEAGQRRPSKQVAARLFDALQVPEPARPALLRLARPPSSAETPEVSEISPGGQLSRSPSAPQPQSASFIG